MKAYSHTHGAGDFYQIEGYMTQEERDSLEVIWYGFNDKQSTALRTAIEACPKYAKVRHCYLSYPTERLEGVPSSMRDHGILHRKVFTGSSFLAEPLNCSIDHLTLPVDFEFVHFATPFNLACVRKYRDCKPHEWASVIKRLEDRDSVGVVINPLTFDEVPDSPRLIDLRGLTTMPQAIEVLKRAKGYIGIDSCFAILAAQLFKREDLLIRTANPYVVSEGDLYYAPHEVIDFLTPEIGKPRYPRMTKPTRELGQIVELRCNALIGFRNFGLGERVEVSPERAKRMIEARQALEVIE